MAGDTDNIQYVTLAMYERDFFMLTLLTPSPKSPRKDMDVFLRPLLDELKML